MTTIVATSDLHGYLPEPGVIEECDILLLAGDLCPVWDHTRQFQASWLRTTFSDWLRAQPAKHIVGIGGNHDFVLSGHKQKLGYELPWIYLNNESVDVGGLKIWGSPLSNRLGNWASMKPEPALADVWRSIPRDIDILMIHGPAYRTGDQAGMTYQRRVDHEGNIADGWEPNHIGSPSLANQLYYDEWPNLKAFVFGHCHEGYGTYGKYYNVSRTDVQYNPINPPVVINV